MRDNFAREIVTRIPGVVVNGDLKRALPHMLNISIPEIQSEYVTLALDAKGISISTKSACREGEERRSHVVEALGEAVLTEANRLTGQSAFDPARLHYRVYVRRAADLAKIRAELSRHVGDALDAVYLQADVCRSDLLLEIEATAVVPRAPAPERQN